MNVFDHGDCVVGVTGVNAMGAVNISSLVV